MIGPNQIGVWEIERAKEFVRKPLSNLFKAWSTLRDRDNVTMTIHELGHLMAWYAAVRAEGRPFEPKELGTGRPELNLPATTEERMNRRVSEHSRRGGGEYTLPMPLPMRYGQPLGAPARGDLGDTRFLISLWTLLDGTKRLNRTIEVRDDQDNHIRFYGETWEDESSTTTTNSSGRRIPGNPGPTESAWRVYKYRQS